MLHLLDSMASLTTIRDMNTNENNTRPTPDSDAIRDRVIAGNCDLDDLLDALERFERERDEAREIALNLQNIMGMKV